MHELVLSTLKIRFSQALKVPSLAGTGLPERMRTTAFAFLGLTAAAGLALVAIFAQISFHVLSPAPLPREPVAGSAVAAAVALDHDPASFVPSARADARGAAERVAAEADPASGSAGPKGGGTAPAEVPGAAPPSDTGAVVQPTGSGAPNPAAPVPSGATSSPAPAPEATPVSNPPAGSSPKPAPPPARPASPTPAAPPAPGNSSSSAAAAHASDRGIEASSKSSATVEPPPAATSSTPPPSTSTGSDNGNGKALGHTK